ncbi:TRM11 family methyltransferase [Acetobacter oryzifermentans]|uniref:Methyltransferase n=1 Tax=Acetobacter oryzifermentans TaxID=1633874 RepID=A0ABN4NQT8_9PROT|nr:hypothetical protein [Acetobacter oryzifermentans]ANA14185.1 hypothetical protein WG31_09370 [Acetobacter oryzifermentans]
MRHSGYERHTDDWYVEPAWCVHALVKGERPFVGTVLDPCCGGGNIVQSLCSNEIEAMGADIRDRADGMYPRMNYEQSLHALRPTSVVSNPPYGVAQEFIMACLDETKDRVCVLLRLAFLEGIQRGEWFPHVPLARVWVSSKRISMPPGGTDIPAKGGAIAYAWFVFEHGWKGDPVVKFLPKVGEISA